MTRWLTLGLVLASGTSAWGQTADVISEVGSFYTPNRPAPIPNPLGGGLLPPMAVVAIAQQGGQQPGVKQPGAQPANGGNQQQIHRPTRSTFAATGPVKLDSSGDALPPGAVARYGSSRLRHGSEPRGLGFSPDGKVLGTLSSGEDGMRLWDPATGKELYRFTSPITLAKFARDGSVLIVHENRCRVWIPAASIVRDLPEKTLSERPHALAVHPDCRSFVASFGAKVQQIDSATGKTLRELKCPNDHIPGRLTFSPDGRWLAASGHKVGVWLWDLRTGKRVRTYQSDFEFPECTFSADGNRIAIAGDQLRIYPIDSEEMIDDYKAPQVVFQSPKFSADGKWLYGICADGSAYKIDARTGDSTPIGTNPEAAFRSNLALSPDAKYAAGIEQSGAARVWEVNTGKEPELNRLPYLFEPGFSSDGKTISCLAADGKVHDFDAASGKSIEIHDLPVEEDAQIFWDPYRRRAIVAYASEETELQAIDVDSKRILRKSALRVDGLAPNIAFCKTDPNRIAAFAPGKVIVLDTSTGKVLRSLEFVRSIVPLYRGAISPDGRLLAVGGQPLSIWEVATGKKRMDLEAVPAAAGAIFSADGRYLAAWDQLGNIMAFDVRTGTIARRFQVVVSEVAGLVVAFSPDGQRLAAGDQDGGVTVWDFATGDTIATLDRHDCGVSGIAFSPDGTRIASTSFDGTTLVWEVVGKPTPKIAETELRGLEEAFGLLASPEAWRAQRGLEYLYRRPAEAIQVCAARIPLPTATPPDKVLKLVADLEHDEYPVRVAAVKELELIGGEALSSLRTAAEKSANPEARKLACEVVKRHETAELKADELRVIRAVELLENIGNSEAKALLAKWAGGPAGHRTTEEASAALARLKPRSH